jgi:hypothetical protein
MGYSKRQFVQAAFEEIGLATYAFDLQPQQFESALRRLDAMMAEWNAKGIRLGYPIPGSPEDSDLDSESEVPDSANEAIITNLAIRIAPSYGRTPMPETKITAKTAYNTLLSRATMPPEQQFPSGLPRGAGWKPWRETNEPFLPGPEDPLTVGPDGPLDFG